MEGRTLSHYRIVQKIGAGGMGVVYRAHDERLDHDVTLKVLPSGLLTDEAARRRFRKEALALSRLNHPNIETVYDFDTQDGVDFLVMQYIPGETLARRTASSLNSRVNRGVAACPRHTPWLLASLPAYLGVRKTGARPAGRRPGNRASAG